MRIVFIIKKAFTEQIRSFWIVLLTLLMAPFFVLIFYLIGESTKLHFDVVVYSEESKASAKSLADILCQKFEEADFDSLQNPFTLHRTESKEDGLNLLRRKKADILISVPDFYPSRNRQQTDAEHTPRIEFTGNLSDYGYILAAIYSYEIIDNYYRGEKNIPPSFELKETALGTSSSMNEFDFYVPGLLILSVIMLLFSSSIAFVSEIERKTILLLRLSGIKTIEFITGTAIVQICIGILSVFLTLLTAIALGFEMNEKTAFLLAIAGLSSLSIIAFSLIIAAATKTTNEILIVGNFPMFLFMFFTGAVFPINSPVLFSFLKYDFQLHALMSPAHAISALNKVLILGAPVSDTLPEIISIIGLTLIYFLTGMYFFGRRHLSF